MKRKELTLAAVLAMIACLAVPSVNAVTKTEAKEIQKAVAQVRLPEMAPVTAKLVANTPKKERLEVAFIALEAIAEKHPAVLASVVGAISKAAPELTEAIAVKAADLAPKEAVAIAKAAASATPKSAAKIAAAMAKPKATKQNAKIANEIASIVPALSASIREAVAKAEAAPAPSLDATRTTATAAHDGGDHGVIQSNPGTIGGTPAGDRNDPTAINAVAGADPDRAYGSPQ